MANAWGTKDSRYSATKTGTAKNRVAGWIVYDGREKGMRVAPWVVKEQKKSLFNSLIGFLKDEDNGPLQAAIWL